jgi:hypothetical protein
MLTHTVFFWLREDAGAGDRAALEAGLRSLLPIPGALRAVIGRPAATAARPVVDHSYDFALELDFADVAAHDAYQQHPVHVAFVESCRPLWRQVKVTDFDHLA